MKTISTLIVEDEAPALKRLIKMVESQPELLLLDIAKSVQEAEEKINLLKPELIFLDIQLKDATAFDLLSKLDKSCNPRIIFVTAFDIYAVKAFETDALDYLLKPFSQERFAASVQKAIKRIEQIDLEKVLQHFKTDSSRESKNLEIPEGNRLHYIHPNELAYLYSEGYYTYFVTRSGKKMIRISLKKSEEVLPENFVRINKSTIINKNTISEIIQNKNSGKVILNDGTEFFLSEKFKLNK